MKHLLGNPCKSALLVLLNLYSTDHPTFISKGGPFVRTVYKSMPEIVGFVLFIISCC